ncbi:NAD(P)-binding protein [Roseomonas sp. PWR1]|uniref:NAD(P)-binding protein n=1 Tax=Roseomonas nitratireducens TaxID=2820810 RepID=A0ABS4API0_9PROT|nr:FAD-dependent oxidoreductase [Neoroseomonas nitratireducens]MBP0463266.1 NAD(P)-binding protein [Neoroseomonas nitratireducens]
MTETIAILGAGLAGLSAARHLAARGIAVRLFDKGRAPGGRLATRRAEHAGRRLQFDHGAQYLRAAGPGFAAALEAAGAAPWPDPARRVGIPGMSALPRALAEGLAITASRHAGRILGEAGAWRIQHWDAKEAKPGTPLPATPPIEDGPFSAVLVTIPAPQAIDLLPGMADALRPVRYAPCWTVMAHFDAKLPLPDTLRPEGHAIGWAARDSSKPGRDGAAECWVVQAAPAWTRAHLEAHAEDIVAPLLAELATLAGAPLPAPAWAAAHRWRYSLLEAPLGQPFLWDATRRIGLAGDWCLAGRAEAAWDSGAALAAALAP